MVDQERATNGAVEVAQALDQGPRADESRAAARGSLSLREQMVSTSSHSDPKVGLAAVDVAEVTLLVDNQVDLLLASEAVAQRPAVVWDAWEGQRPTLLAEHGLSLLLSIERAGQRSSILYDAGLGALTALHNLDALEISVTGLRAIVVSHGHTDHHGGLHGMLSRVGRRGLPLVIHPDAWRDRRVAFPGGAMLHLPAPSRADIEREGIAVTEQRQPSLLIDDAVLVTGEVERVTPFERGFPLNQARDDGGWRPDPLILDDQALVVCVRGQGLVILSACSHAGIINVIRQAQRLTGIDRVLGVIGGLHLSGGLFEPIIPATLDELVAIAPRWIVPGHCTGWRAIHAIARRMPHAYVVPSVGTCLRFAG